MADKTRHFLILLVKMQPKDAVTCAASGDNARRVGWPVVREKQAKSSSHSAINQLIHQLSQTEEDRAMSMGRARQWECVF